MWIFCNFKSNTCIDSLFNSSILLPWNDIKKVKSDSIKKFMKNTSVDKFSVKQAYKKEKLREFLIRFLYLFEIASRRIGQSRRYVEFGWRERKIFLTPLLFYWLVKDERKSTTVHPASVRVPPITPRSEFQGDRANKNEGREGERQELRGTRM